MLYQRPQLRRMPTILATLLVTLGTTSVTNAQMRPGSFYNCDHDYDVFLENMPDFDQRRSPMWCSGGKNHCFPASIVNAMTFMADHGNAGPDPGVGIGPGFSDQDADYDTITDYMENLGVRLATSCTFGTASMFHVDVAIQTELMGSNFGGYRYVHAGVSFRWSPNADHLVRDLLEERAVIIAYYGKYPHWGCLFSSRECLSFATGGHVMVLRGGTKQAEPATCETHENRTLSFSNSSFGEDPQDLEVQSNFRTDSFEVVNKRVRRGIYRTRMARVLTPWDDSTRWKLIRGYTKIVPRCGCGWHASAQEEAGYQVVTDSVTKSKQIQVHHVPVPENLDPPIAFAMSPYDQNIWSLVPTVQQENLLMCTNVTTGESTFPHANVLDHPTNILFDRHRNLVVVDGNEIVRIGVDIDIGWEEGEEPFDPVMRHTLQIEPEAFGYSEQAASFYAYDTETGLLSVIEDHQTEDPSSFSVSLPTGLTSLGDIEVHHHETDSEETLDTVMMVASGENSVHTVTMNGKTISEFKTFDVPEAEFCTSMSMNDRGHLLLSIDSKWQEFSFEPGVGFTRIMGDPFTEIEMGDQAMMLRSTSNQDEVPTEENGQEPVVQDNDSDTPFCLGDLDGDGEVGGADLGLMIAQWGTWNTADLNDDGDVGGADLGLLIAEWGPCPDQP